MTNWFFPFLVALCLLLATTCHADVSSKVIRETAEFLIKRGGRKVAGETVETLNKKMGTLAVRHSDDLVVAAFRRVGPRAAKIATEAGEHCGTALRLMSRYGDDAIRIAARPKALKLAASLGDDIAGPLIRHGEVGEKLIERFGSDGAAALSKLSEQNARRLAILVKEQGEKVTPDLVQAVAKHSNADAVADWVWKHKGSLFVGTALATFVANPDTYVDAVESVAHKTLDVAVQPLADVPVTIATEAAANTNWTLIGILVLAIASIGGWWVGQRIRSAVGGLGGADRPKESGVPWPRKDQ